MTDFSAVAIIALQQRLLALKLLPRTGWLQRGVAQPESIAEHTFGVATLALLVGDRVPCIRRERLLVMALLHDMAEAVIGDLPHTARNYLGKATKDDAERRALADLLAPLPACDDYMQLWDEYTQRTSREARLLKQLDRLEMLIQAVAYAQAGNRLMNEFWSDITEGWDNDFPILHELVHELVAQIGDHAHVPPAPAALPAPLPPLLASYATNGHAPSPAKAPPHERGDEHNLA